MYATRRFNEKKLESYLTIGDPYDKSRSKDPRHGGKQFQTNPAKTGQLQGYFSITPYQPDSYQDTNGYRVTQPRGDRRHGFGSMDAHRRDEFTLDIRAHQYKELLKSEFKFTKKFSSSQPLPNTARVGHDIRDQYCDGIDDAQQAFTERRAQELLPSLFQNQVPGLLFDIGRERGTTPICNKCPRDTFYCKHRVGSGETTLRRAGPHKTAAQIVGDLAERNTPSKPPHGRKSHIKDFYDANHLTVHDQ